MKARKGIGIALMVIGAAMLLFSNYIAEQVAIGKMKIARGQSQVDTIDSVFSMSKYSKPIGDQITNSAQKKIDAGQYEVDKYEAMSSNLKVGGIILLVIGAGLTFFPTRRRG